MRDWANVLGVECHQRNGCPLPVNKLDFVGGTLLVNVNDRTNVAFVKVHIRDITIQYDHRMFSKHGSYPGYAVINRGAVSCSMIHIETTRARRCPGRPISPLTSYFTPNGDGLATKSLLVRSINASGGPRALAI
jgi:hypothetical protein